MLQSFKAVCWVILQIVSSMLMYQIVSLDMQLEHVANGVLQHVAAILFKILMLCSHDDCCCCCCIFA